MVGRWGEGAWAGVGRWVGRWAGGRAGREGTAGTGSWQEGGHARRTGRVWLGRAAGTQAGGQAGVAGRRGGGGAAARRRGGAGEAGGGGVGWDVRPRAAGWRVRRWGRPLQHAGLRMCGGPVHGGAGGAQRAGAGERPREGGTGGAALSQPPRGAGCSPGLARPPGTGALRAAAVRLLPRAWCAGGSERVGGLRCGAVGARTRARAARLSPGGSEGSQESELYL